MREKHPLHTHTHVWPHSMKSAVTLNIGNRNIYIPHQTRLTAHGLSLFVACFMSPYGVWLSSERPGSENNTHCQLAFSYTAGSDVRQRQEPQKLTQTEVFRRAATGIVKLFHRRLQHTQRRGYGGCSIRRPSHR